MSISARRLVIGMAAVLPIACSEQPPTGPEQGPRFDRATPQYEFVTIELPLAGVTSVNPQGINAGGTIVGSYVQGGVTRGFVLHDGVVETVIAPEAGPNGHTILRGIDPDGNIVGTWRPAGTPGGVTYGFRRSAAGQFSAVSFAGRAYVIPQRILPDGTMLGCAHDLDGTNAVTDMIGVRFTAAGNEAADILDSMHNGGTPDGRRIVGLYTNTAVAPPRGEGYLLESGVFTSLRVPNSLSTAAWDMNPRGDIVGVYQSADRKVHGFVLTEAGFITLDFPNATETRPFGINARGDVVGRYVQGGVARGFLARRVR